MADASSGVGGSSQGSASNAASDQAARDAAAAAQAAETAAAQATASSALANATATTAVQTVQAAPVDLSVSPATLAQLGAMPVDAQPPSLADLPSVADIATLGGVPTTPANYADIAAAPQTPAVEETSVFSLDIGFGGYTQADIDAANAASLNLGIGVDYNGTVTGADTVTAELNARMGLTTGQLSVDGKYGYTDGLNSFSASFTAGPFGPDATPSYTGTVTSGFAFGNLSKAEFNASTTFGDRGFTSGYASFSASTQHTDTLDSAIQGRVDVDRDGFANARVDARMGYNDNGVSLGLSTFGQYNRDNGASWGIGAGIKGRF